MKHLSEDTRVLVADGAYALVLRNDGDGAFPNLRLERAYEQDNPATREQGSDKPGRMNDSLGRISAMESTDWHKVAEDRFVQRIADDMAKDLKAGEFRELVLAAPARGPGGIPQGCHERLDRCHHYGNRQGPDQSSHRQDREDHRQGAGRSGRLGRLFPRGRGVAPVACRGDVSRSPFPTPLSQCFAGPSPRMGETSRCDSLFNERRAQLRPGENGYAVSGTGEKRRVA